MDSINRRDLIRNGVLGAAGIAAAGLLSACSSGSQASNQGTSSPASNTVAEEIPLPTYVHDASKDSNFEVVPDSKTTVGTTYENLLTALVGETGAKTKYLAYSEVAKQEGFDQIARLFAVTADAEQIHIDLEFEQAKKIDPNTKLPEPPIVEKHGTGVNLILGANGEIYETSDMYPAFTKKALEEGNKDTAQVFMRAKLAEAYHAELYLDAYNIIDAPDDATYYLCPVCGFIHKGDSFSACPICFQPKENFKAY